VLKKVLCSWESPFAIALSGAPSGDYLSRAIVDCRGAPTVDTAFMGLTSFRRITIARTLAHRRDECAIGIMPTAVSLSNTPPTTTPSTAMGQLSDKPPAGVRPGYRPLKHKARRIALQALSVRRSLVGAERFERSAS
jgi:hypothetical protein